MGIWFRDAVLPGGAEVRSVRAMKRILAVWAAAWAWVAVSMAAEPGVLTQWSTIDALLKGHYDGEVSLAEVKQHGDFGLGTYEGLDGEMVLLDGCVYQVTSDGKVRRPGDAERSPLAAVAFFKTTDIELTLPAGLTLEQVQARVDAALPSRNLFYAVRVDGRFDEVRTRSVARQSKPYPPLATVVKTQALFTLAKTEGTLVGLRCPEFSKGVNVPGYHFHYLTLDRTGGGHMLGLVTGEGARARVVVLREWSVKLPASAAFDALDLSGDRAAELKAVESERK